MDALKPPRPLDKRERFDIVHISAASKRQRRSPFLLPLIVLFITFFSFGLHRNIKESFVASQCCGHESDLLIPCCQTEVTSTPLV